MTHPETWLPHDGGDCPVSPETMVRVRPTYGLDFGWVPASMVTWQNVTSYQISDPASPVGVEKGEGVIFTDGEPIHEGDPDEVDAIVAAFNADPWYMLKAKIDIAERVEGLGGITMTTDFAKKILEALTEHTALSASPSPTPQPPLYELNPLSSRVEELEKALEIYRKKLIEVGIFEATIAEMDADIARAALSPSNGRAGE